MLTFFNWIKKSSVSALKWSVFQEKNSRSSAKYGGALTFSPIYNGKVLVIYSYPYIERWLSEQEECRVAEVSPVDIDTEFVLKHVHEFMDEMIKWERLSGLKGIGFVK